MYGCPFYPPGVPLPGALLPGALPVGSLLVGAVLLCVLLVDAVLVVRRHRPEGHRLEGLPVERHQFPILLQGVVLLCVLVNGPLPLILIIVERIKCIILVRVHPVSNQVIIDVMCNRQMMSLFKLLYHDVGPPLCSEPKCVGESQSRGNVSRVVLKVSSCQSSRQVNRFLPALPFHVTPLSLTTTLIRLRSCNNLKPALAGRQQTTLTTTLVTHVPPWSTCPT